MLAERIADFALERRARFRYPLELNVRYRTLPGARAWVGTGRTLNVSSCGLLIWSQEEIVEDGSRLQVSVDWPITLNGATPLQLLAECRVIRRQPAGFAVRIEHHQFRTKSSHGEQGTGALNPAACSAVFA
ncbi:MAG TPA: PilZ domain-containing protein [Bryobacteraceae bacterium]|nr:PilZ domain-containing protein [Bryobacteraceae bacterium]